MNNKRCANCGCVYNTDIYGDLCPLCHSKRIESASPEQEIGHSAYHEEIPCVYGPPPIQNKEKGRDYPESHSTIYGPPPINYEPYQKTHSVIYGPSPVKKFSYSVIIFIIGAFLGGIIMWLLGDCSIISHSTVYGPPPIDTIQSGSPK